MFGGHQLEKKCLAGDQNEQQIIEDLLDIKFWSGLPEIIFVRTEEETKLILQYKQFKSPGIYIATKRSDF